MLSKGRPSAFEWPKRWQAGQGTHAGATPKTPTSGQGLSIALTVPPRRRKKGYCSRQLPWRLSTPFPMCTTGCERVYTCTRVFLPMSVSQVCTERKARLKLSFTAWPPLAAKGSIWPFLAVCQWPCKSFLKTKKPKKLEFLPGRFELRHSLSRRL